MPFGYQPVGIIPRILPVLVSITATALIPPQAAYSVEPSAEICRAVGAIPRTGWENGWIGMVRVTWKRTVSITEMLSLFPFAT